MFSCTFAQLYFTDREMQIDKELINKQKLLTAVQYCMKIKYHL
jgi:hypothetical protein